MLNKNVAFTIIAQNYTGYGIVLAESMKKSNPDMEFFIFFADGICEELKNILKDKGINGVDVTHSRDYELFLDMAFYYEVTEYCTAIKPFVITEFFDKGYDKVCYIDPDIYVYQSLQEHVLEQLEIYNAVFTPHICSPITDKFIPDEQMHLKTGTFNLGFVALKNNEIGRSIAGWWAEKCRLTCFNDQASGLFVDQKWTNLLPGLFDGVFISRYLGLNMAYWNLHERKLIDYKVNGRDDLIFYHFSGFVLNDINNISKYQNRFNLDYRKDLKLLFEDYKIKLTEAVSSLPGLPSYKYNYYSDGRFISLLARRFYYWKRSELENPFLGLTQERIFLSFLAKHGVKERVKNDSISSPDDINKKTKYFHLIMALVLRISGPNRYSSLCKYFGYLSSIHNHRFLLKDQAKTNVIGNNKI